MRILACGDRNWTDVAAICIALNPYAGSDHVLIHGDCRGADRLAETVAKERGWQVISCPADWKGEGGFAGPRRNHRMLRLNPDIVIAFHVDIERSKGTKHMVGAARDQGVPVRLVGAIGH